MFKKTGLWLSAGALLMLSACAQPPQEAIDGANAALESARTAEAPEYAPEAWQLAQDANSSAMAEIQAQNEKFSMLRSYDTATQLLDKATQAANAAATEATTAREEAKRNAEALIEEAQVALDAAKAALESAPRGKGTQADIMAMQAEVEAMTASLAAAREAVASGKYRAAESGATSVRDQANAIAADISQAKGKRRG
jgi:hypothetical protein